MMMRDVQMNKATTAQFLRLLHCGCRDAECECRKIPKRLAVVWARHKLLADKLGHGGRCFSDETVIHMAIEAGVMQKLPDDVELSVEGAEMLVPKVGRPKLKPDDNG